MDNVLQRAQKVVEERGQVYGGPLESHARIAAGWSQILQVKVGPEEVALCLLWMKISREVGKRQIDNIDDMAGYVYCYDRVTEELYPEDRQSPGEVTYDAETTHGSR